MNGFAYISDENGGLQIIDVTNPEFPVYISNIESIYAYRTEIHDSLLNIAGRIDGYFIAEITNPGFPQLIGSYNTGGYNNDTYVLNNILYSVQAGNGLIVLDIADPSTPTKLARLEMDYAYQITGSGSYVYVINNGKLEIVDISVPSLPVIVSTWDGMYVNAITIKASYAYLGGSIDLIILDISEPENPFVVGQYNGLSSSPRGIDVLGDNVFLANTWSGLYVLDISDPTTPSLSGSLQTFDYAVSVSAQGDYVYVADRYEGYLHTVDITDPSNPVSVGAVYTQEARNVKVAGQYAYVINAWDGVRLIDIADPEDPIEIGYFDTKGYAQDVFVDGSKLYVADGGGGTYILENPLNGEISVSDTLFIDTLYTGAVSSYTLEINNLSTTGILGLALNVEYS